MLKKKPKVDDKYCSSHEHDKIAADIISHFKKIYPGLDPKNVHNFHICHSRNCREISSADLTGKSKDNKFQHKWLFDYNHAYCERTGTWNLVYIDGKGMFCETCREFDSKQAKNSGKQWNSAPNVRCRTETIQTHLKSVMHSEAVEAKKRLSSSFLDTEEKNG